MKVFFIIYVLTFSLLAFAHNGHGESIAQSIEGVQHNEIAQPGRPTSWTQWIGNFHLILIHFPIALINMLVISELFWAWTKKPIFEFSSRFLLISAAILAPITAILGLILSYTVSFQGLVETFLWWHMSLGILTAGLVVALAFIKENMGPSKLYYTGLMLLFLLVNLTSFFGGGMTFGPYHMYPPEL